MKYLARWMSGLMVALALSATSLSAEVQRESPRALSHDELEAWLDGYLPYALEQGDVAGAVVVVVKDGQVLLQKGYGYSDAAGKRPVDPEATLFRPGSVSKLFTWTAVMQQVELGKLDLDRDVNAYLDFRIPPFRGQPITLRNLMTHTPGFQYALEDVVSTDPRDVSTLASYASRRAPPRIFAPGAVPSYSNYGVALAGYIVQRISGQPFEDYIEQHVFRPLGMRHATFRQPLPEELRSQMSKGYRLASEPPKAYEFFPGSPYGGAAVSGADMGKFMIAHLQNGDYQGQRILREETARLMHTTPHTVVSPVLNRMLLGFFEFDHGGRRVIGHEGDSIWFHSVLQLYLDEHVGLFVSLNSIGRDAAARAIRARLMEGFANRYFPSSSSKVETPLSFARDNAASMVGRYDGSQGEPTGFLSLLSLATQVSVTSNPAGQLSVSSIVSPTGQPLWFEEIQPFLWQQIGGHRHLAARVVDGKVVMWAEDANSADEAYLPTPWWRSAAWLLPALVGSLIVALLTTVAWPIGAFFRRRHGVKLSLQGDSARAFRWVRIAVAAAVVVFAAWAVTIGIMISTFAVSSRVEPWILFLHLASIVIFPAMAVAAVWNLWVTVMRREVPGDGWVLFWNGLLAVSGCILLWVAVVFHLIGLGLHF